MLNKEYIEGLLREDKTIDMISITRTQFSPIMTEFYFFNTFFQVLRLLKIDSKSRKDSKILDGEPVLFCYIEFTNGKENYTTQYDPHELERELRRFNNLQGEMSMRESANTLIDIFLSLLL